MSVILTHVFKDKIPNIDEFCRANNECGFINTINSFCNRVKFLSDKYSLQINPEIFKGESLELLSEYILKTTGTDNRIGIYNYSPIDSTEYENGMWSGRINHWTDRCKTLKQIRKESGTNYSIGYSEGRKMRKK